MRPITYSTKTLIKLFKKKKVLTLADIKDVLQTNSKMTINRKLKLISYRTSYSHAGSYYTIDDIALYNSFGLWGFNQIYFSKHGTLEHTIEYLINTSEAGYFGSELKDVLKVFVYNALSKLFSFQKVTTTKKGLRVNAILNDKIYERGIKINDSDMNDIRIKNNELLPKWNYTISS